MESNLYEEIKELYGNCWVNDSFQKLWLEWIKNKEEMKKITPKTKIKELIPEGYKLIDDTYTTNTEGLLIMPDDPNIIHKLLFFQKKQPEKDFNWYVDKYKCKKVDYVSGQIHVTKWSFEFKIGLLKFICDDLGVSFFEFIYNEYFLNKHEWSMPSINFNKVKNICPEEFLKSIVQ